jgi:hypothetical protein
VRATDVAMCKYPPVMTQGPKGTPIWHRCTLAEMPHMIEHRRADAVAAGAKLC